MGAAGFKLAMVAAVLLGYGRRDVAVPSPEASCPEGMALVDTFCIDRWEDYVVEVDDDGVEHDHSPYEPVDGLSVRAKTAPGVVPQGYISQVQSAQACASAGKRLCSEVAFRAACRGPDANDLYPYGGRVRKPGYCNEGKGSMMPRYYGNDPRRWSFEDFNDARLNQTEGGLAKTGSYPRCKSPEGVWDCVGNLH
ncbi:MAG TPA: hypothetical protein VK762_16895, partial [Polyangiaceae bacterium]|nr:hypothetical protein [Polyangiaceae bacterium]